jgi:hypothetical protein
VISPSGFEPSETETHRIEQIEAWEEYPDATYGTGEFLIFLTFFIIVLLTSPDLQPEGLRA